MSYLNTVEDLSINQPLLTALLKLPSLMDAIVLDVMIFSTSKQRPVIHALLDKLSTLKLIYVKMVQALNHLLLSLIKLM